MFPTREDVHGIKRLEVLREAAASFNFKGYHATSMNEIAASLGVTKAALYHYFPNKNSLLAACFEHAFGDSVGDRRQMPKRARGGKHGRDGALAEEEFAPDRPTFARNVRILPTKDH